MPPPPVPRQNGGTKGVIPMTPASLMNLGRAGGEEDTALRQPGPGPPPKRQAAMRKAAIVIPPVITVKKGVTKVATGPTGKRTLAIRSPGGVGIRAGEWSATSISLTKLIHLSDQRRGCFLYPP